MVDSRSSHKHDVILLPGAVLPADLAYSGLMEALGPEVNALAKELELYATDSPPPGYTLDAEVRGILEAADAAGMDSFHLVGYSAGGAGCLMFAARHPDRLRSLALLEPAWAGNEGLSAAEQRAWNEYRRIVRLPAPEMMPAFVRANLRPGVEPPPAPSGDPPPWMAKRPAGIAALTGAFASAELDTASLGALGVPVYYALGGLSNPDQYGEGARRLGEIFSDFTLETFEERHHFDPPHRAEPDRLAASLRKLWDR